MNEALQQPGASRAAIGPRPSRWPMRLLVLLGLALTLLLAASLLIHQLPGGGLPVHINVNGWEMTPSLGMQQMPAERQVALVAALLGVLLLVMLIVPVAVLLVLGVLLLVILLAVGLPLVLVLGVMTLLVSPLLLLVWLLWKLLS